MLIVFFFFFSSRRRHTRCYRDWSSDVCSSDLVNGLAREKARPLLERIARLAAEADERREVATHALAGSLRGLAPLAHSIADDLEHEAIDADALRRIAATTYAEELASLATAIQGGLMLREE